MREVLLKSGQILIFFNNNTASLCWGMVMDILKDARDNPLEIIADIAQDFGISVNKKNQKGVFFYDYKK